MTNPEHIPDSEPITPADVVALGGIEAQIEAAWRLHDGPTRKTPPTGARPETLTNQQLASKILDVYKNQPESGYALGRLIRRAMKRNPSSAEFDAARAVVNSLVASNQLVKSRDGYYYLSDTTPNPDATLAHAIHQAGIPSAPNSPSSSINGTTARHGGNTIHRRGHRR